jgi:hypothetical protein
MLDLCKLIFGMVIDLLWSRAALEAEILVLRQQINVLRRANPKRLRFVSIDRLILGGVCRLFPKMYGALAIVRPETVIRWTVRDLDRIGDGNRSTAADDRP